LIFQEEITQSATGVI